MWSDPRCKRKSFASGHLPEPAMQTDAPPPPLSQPAATLRAHGLRTTPQRALIYQILRQAESHLDAEGIWQQARQQKAEINLATVYRALSVLIRSGLVQQSYLGEGQKRAYYEVLTKPRHVHFACRRCGQVLELESEAIFAAQRELESRSGIRIERVHIKFEGLCATCTLETE